MDTLLPLLSADLLGTAAWIWLVFAALVVALLAFDLGVLHKDDRAIGHLGGGGRNDRPRSRFRAHVGRVGQGQASAGKRHCACQQPTRQARP